MTLDSSINFFIKNPHKYILVTEGLTVKSLLKQAGMHTTKLALEALKQISEAQATTALQAYRASIEPVKNFCNLYGFFHYKLTDDQKLRCHNWCESALTEEDFVSRRKAFEKGYHLYAHGYLTDYFVTMPRLQIVELMQIISFLPESPLERISSLIDPIVLGFFHGIIDEKDRSKIIMAIDKIPLVYRASILEAMAPFVRHLVDPTLAITLPFAIACNLNNQEALTAICQANEFYNEPIAKKLALSLAAQYGLEQAASFLLKDAAIDEQDKKTAFLDAACHGHLKVLQVFPQDIFNLHQEQAILGASARGHVNIVRALYQPTTSIECKNQAFYRAYAISQSVDLVTFFIQEANIPESVRAQAYVDCCFDQLDHIASIIQQSNLSTDSILACSKAMGIRVPYNKRSF